MTQLKKIAFISHVFPPSNRANAKRPFFLVNSFLKKGWSTDVFSSKQGIPAEITEEAFPDEKRCSIFRINDPLWNLHQILETRGGWLQGKLDSLLQAFVWPDLASFWCWKVAHKLNARDYDAIVLCVHPKSALLLPLLCKNKTAIWIVDYQDSVSAQFKRYPRRSPLHRVLTPMLTNLEKKTLSRVDHAIFTSESSRQAYIDDGLVSKAKTTYISHFFDENLYDRSLGWDGKKLSILYAGFFDRIGRRSPEIFLRSFNGLLRKYPEAAGLMSFDFYGRWWPEHDQFIEELELQDSVSIHPAVPYAEYLKLLQTSAVLLLITAPVHNLFIPGKLIDYLGACRPVLAFTPSDSETSGVLRSVSMNNYLCSDSDVSEGSRTLEEVWNAFCEMKLSGSTPNEVADWSSEKLAEQFVCCVEGFLS